jgi:DNA topoisomerase-2
MFNAESKLKKYESVQEIIDEFYDVRIAVYKKRKDALIVSMQQQLVKLSMRAKYIQDILSGQIDLRRKKTEEVNRMLESMAFTKIEGDFKYLVKMPMDSVTEENVEKIMREKADLERELNVLIGTSLEQIWLSELGELEKQYDIYKLDRVRIQSGAAVGGEKKKVVIKRVVVKK